LGAGHVPPLPFPHWHRQVGFLGALADLFVDRRAQRLLIGGVLFGPCVLGLEGGEDRRNLGIVPPGVGIGGVRAGVAPNGGPGGRSGRGGRRVGHPRSVRRYGSCPCPSTPWGTRSPRSTRVPSSTPRL